MNIYVILCLFAIFSTNVNSKSNYQHFISNTNYIVEQMNGQNGIFDLEIIKLKVKNAVWNVESVIQQLEHIRIEKEEDTLITVIKRWWDQMDNYRNYVNQLLLSMRREVTAAKAKHKDAQHCYDTNFCAISQYNDIAYGAAEKCEESAKNSIKKNLGFIDNLISFGKTLVMELNDLLIICHDNDSIKMQSCILTELGTINISVRSFEETMKYIKFQTLPISDYVVLQASKCLHNAYLLARVESEGAKLSNSRCVQDILENKKNVIKKLVFACKLRVTSV